MSIYNGDYMRVLTPETTDGQNLRIVNDRVVYKESHMPFNETAKKMLEQENLRLPPHLRHKIEIVQG
jgi:hypothetical protein